MSPPSPNNRHNRHPRKQRYYYTHLCSSSRLRRRRPYLSSLCSCIYTAIIGLINWSIKAATTVGVKQKRIYISIPVHARRPQYGSDVYTHVAGFRRVFTTQFYNNNNNNNIMYTITPRRFSA